jgi:thioredoxin-dependent peroxiredoxin
MTQITFKGNPIHTFGSLPKIGQKAPNSQFTLKDLIDVDLNQYKGKRAILNIFPSLDTGTCAASVRKFNQEASKLNDNVVVLCISADLPFAQSRFCGAEGLNHVVTGSVFRHPEFGEIFGVRMTDGPLAGLLSRAIVVFNENQEVIYTQQVPEITDEPDYDKALSAVHLR